VRSWTDPPAVVAHRGSPREAPENTLASFRRALAAGAEAIELDARLTRDGEVVVMHDPALGRTAEGKELVEDLAADELRARDAGAWFDPRFRGERVPTLREVLRALPSTLLDVELKADASNVARLPARVRQIVEQEGAQERVLATSFDPVLAAEYAELAERDAGVIAPFPLDPGDLKEFPRLRHVMLVQDAAEPDVVARLAGEGIRVHVWTVNDEATARDVIARGASGVITDRPAAILKTLAGP
jgi:glycerophosphoryl diester phosphodiesterase